MATRLDELLRRFDPSLPLERAHTIPSTWYFDPTIYAAECRTVFGNTWQMVGRVEQLAERGAFFTVDLAGEPIVVLRDAEGVPRAFSNVCRHRAARVVEGECGHLTRLRCRYHGWTYDLTGRLRGTPEFDGVADFPREEMGLAPWQVATWGPWVWIRAQDTQTPTLAEFLGPLPERCSGSGLEELRFAERREYVVACNWKVFVDNYLDGGYHVNTVHPSLAGVLDYAHYRTEIAGHTSVQSSPLRPVPAEGRGAALSKVRTGPMAYYWWIFPNFMLNIYQGTMDTNLVLPLGPERCRVLFDFYFSPSALLDPAQSIAVADQVQQEDATICEEVQRGLASRSFDTGRFSVRREGAGYHFHRLLAGFLQSQL